MIVKTFCPCASQEPEGADQVESIKAPKDTERILKQQVQQRSFNRSFHTNSFISIGGNNSFISSGGAPEDANSRSAPLTLEVCCSILSLILYTRRGRALPTGIGRREADSQERLGRPCGSSLSLDKLVLLLTVVSASLLETSFSIRLCNALNSTDKLLENVTTVVCMGSTIP